MSDYTITLKRCSELYGKDEVVSWFYDYNLANYLTFDQIDELMRQIDIVGNVAWSPERLAEMIYDHYLMREIAYETPTLFRHYSKVKMQEIMGKYLPLLWSASIQYDPLKDTPTFSYTEEFKGKKDDERNNDSNSDISSEGTSTTQGNSNSTSASAGSSSGLQVNSDTPQGQINKNEVLAGKYASSTTANENENSNSMSDRTSSSSSNNLTNSESRTNKETSTGLQNEEYTRTKSGHEALKMTSMERINQYRKTIQNYNLQIIEECNSLFFALY